MRSIQGQEADRGDGPWAIGELLPEVLANMIGEPAHQAKSTSYIDLPYVAGQTLAADLMVVG